MLMRTDDIATAAIVIAIAAVVAATIITVALLLLLDEIVTAVDLSVIARCNIICAAVSNYSFDICVYVEPVDCAVAVAVGVCNVAYSRSATTACALIDSGWSIIQHETAATTAAVTAVTAVVGVYKTAVAVAAVGVAADVNGKMQIVVFVAAATADQLLRIVTAAIATAAVTDIVAATDSDTK